MGDGGGMAFTFRFIRLSSLGFVCLRCSASRGSLWGFWFGLFFKPSLSSQQYFPDRINCCTGGSTVPDDFYPEAHFRIAEESRLMSPWELAQGMLTDHHPPELEVLGRSCFWAKEDVLGPGLPSPNGLYFLTKGKEPRTLWGWCWF